MFDINYIANRAEGKSIGGCKRLSGPEAVTLKP
jgi:hypothetical protein